MNKERILRVAQLVENGHHKFNGVHAAFDMGVYIHELGGEDLPPYEYPDCNTLACIAGFTVLEYGRKEDIGGKLTDHNARRLLDISFDEAGDLFAGTLKATPKRAAAVLRHFAETGEVAWGIFNDEGMRR